jgi:signal transduction histidine kinase
MPYLIKDRVEFLAEAGKIMGSSLDYNVTLASVAKLIVENVADFCMIDVFEGNEMKRVAVKVSNSNLQKKANEFFNYPPDPRNKMAIYAAARAGQPIIIKKVTNKWLKTVTRIKEEMDLVYSLKHRSYIFAPLISRDKVIGVMTIASNNINYDESDVLFIQELASRAGNAVDKAKLYKEAQEAIRERDEFLAIASHELRTPLTSILLNLQLVLRKIRNTPKDKLKMDYIIKMMEYSETQSFKLSRLINDLLNISVVSSGRLKIEKEKMDFVDLVQSVLNKYNSQITDSKVNVKFNSNGLSSVEGIWDKVRLEQVVSNLLSNALKYGRGKPVSLNLHTKDNKVIFEVKDRGIGVSEDQQKYLFEKFSRAVSDRDYKGLGVGLYISKQIVEAHEGTIDVKSEKNKGSAFRVVLPTNLP